MVGRLRTAARAMTGDDWFLAAACTLAVGLSLWLIRDLWDAGIAFGSDSGAHYVRAEVALEQFFPRGRLDGWQDRFGVGYQQSLFLGPGFNVVVGLVRLVTLGLVSTDDAVKVVMTLSYAGAPIVVAVLGRSFRLSKRAAGAAALLSLGVTSTMGGAGLAGMFRWSLVPHALGAVFSVLALAGVVAILRRPTRRRVIATAVAIAAVIFTHPWAMLVVVVFVACLLGTYGAERALYAGLGGRDPEHTRTPWVRPMVERTVAVAAAGGLGALIGFMQLLPTVVHGDLKGDDSKFPDFALIERYRDAINGRDFLRPYVMVLVFLGLAYLVTRVWARRPFALVLLTTPITFLVIARALRNLVPHNLLAEQLTNRALFLLGFFGVLATAALVGDLGRGVAWLRRRLRPAAPAPARPWAVAGAALVLAALVALITVPTAPPSEFAAVDLPTPEAQHAADALRQLVPEGGRYAVQRSDVDEARSGVWFPEFWLNWASGRNALNYYNLESSAATDAVKEWDRLDTTPPEVKADRLLRSGVTHLLLFKPEAVPALLASPRFPRVWSEGDLVIVAVVEADGRPARVPFVRAEGTTGTLVRAEPEHLAADLTTDRPTTATLAVGWSPKWQATIDGRPVELSHTRDRILTVDLPAGSHRLELTFRPDLVDRVGQAVSGVTVLGLLVVPVVRRRRRAHGRDEPAAGPPLNPDAAAAPAAPTDRRDAASAGSRPTG